MTESRRPPRRGRGARPRGETAPDASSEADPYRDASDSSESPPADPAPSTPSSESAGDGANAAEGTERSDNGSPREQGQGQRGANDRGERPERNGRGRRGRRQRGRGRGGDNRGDNRGENRSDNRGNREPKESRDQGPPVIDVVDGETSGWFDPARDAGFIRRAEFSYLNEQGDAWVSPHLIKEFGLRRGDAIVAKTGRDQRGRNAVAEIVTLNDTPPDPALRRPDFQTLTASYPERRLTLETGAPAKGGPELTRRAIDLIAPIGYGQRALIVAPARAGKTMLMHAMTEGIAINHPEVTLLILLVDERPEEVSEAISWGVGEVVASSFDQPAKRHVEVVEMVLERARRLVEHGKDVVIVLDSLTRMARAFNTAERGTGRTLSGGLDTSAHGAARRPSSAPPARSPRRTAAARSRSSPPRSSRPARGWTT